MEFRLLRTFVAVAEQRHFARAASLLNLSQPAVSHQIALLEEEVGARLLNRASRRVSLTVAGEVMLEEARRILAGIDRARERMQEVARGSVGRIRLGASPTPGLYLLPPILASYGARHATYDLRLEVGPAHRIAERVAGNELDMAVLGGSPATSELRSRPLVSDDLIVIAPARHALARVRSIKPSRLAAECWIVREEGSETHRALLSWWHRHHLHPSRTMAFDSPDGVLRAVVGGLGIALTSALTATEQRQKRTIVALDMRGALPNHSFVLVDHPQKHHGAACRAMLTLLAERFPA